MADGYNLVTSIPLFDNALNSVDGGFTTQAVVISGTNVAQTMPMGLGFQLHGVRYATSIATTTADSVITFARREATGTDTSICSVPMPFTDSTVGDVVVSYVGNLGDTYFAPGEALIATSGGQSDAGSGWFFAIGSYVVNGSSAVASFAEESKEPDDGVGNLIYAVATAL